MKCENVIDLVVDSLMDTLDDEQRAALDAHLETCASCAAEAETMRMMWEGLGELGAPEAGPRVAVELGRRLADDRSRRRSTPLLRAAAVIALLLAGAAGGYVARGGGSPVVTSHDPNTFMFLVRGEEPQAPVSGSELVQEYIDWASSLGEEGRLVGGNKLTDEPGRWVSTATTETRTQSDVSGYFIIAAADYDEAIRIAGTSPHIRYGGTFEIRRIDPLDEPPAVN